MKHLGLVWVLLLLGIGALMGPATAQLTAGQSVPPSVNLGDSAMVTVTLTYYGNNATQAVITPGLPPGIETSYPHYGASRGRLARSATVLDSHESSNQPPSLPLYECCR